MLSQRTRNVTQRVTLTKPSLTQGIRAYQPLGDRLAVFAGDRRKGQ